MSKREWESGTIKIPAKEWAPLKKALIETHNEHQKMLFEMAQKIYVYLKVENKGKRNLNQELVLLDLQDKNDKTVFITLDKMTEADKKYLNIGDKRWITIYLNKLSVDDIIAIGDRIINRTTKKFQKPKKQDFDFVNSKVEYLEVNNESSITFSNHDKSIYWSVDENSHAVDRARENPVAKVLFKRLNSIQFTSKTGGEIVGNDENNEDSYEAGGGANYVVQRFEKSKNKPKYRY